MRYPSSPSEARAMGAGKYAGRECPSHPTALRYAANARCVECAKAERKAASLQPDARSRDAARKRAARAAAQRTAELFSDLLG